MPQLTNAALEWDAAGWPRSLSYGDIYYSSADALGESTHVFLEGNLLPARWPALDARHFVIGELGFGSGLNFMNACRLWCELAPADSQLHYIGCELHPLAIADMQRVHAHWPALGVFSMELLHQYPDHTAGVHQMVLRMRGREIRLTLLYGDAAVLLTGLHRPDGFRVDAWFLDGFAPKLNPALWQTELLQVLARLSRQGTTLATYSVAGEFRRNLADAGFAVRKVRGYANKREMLQAEFTTDGASAERAEPRSVCIVGGGLAGCSTAAELARSGWQVYLLEQGNVLATQGSGNPQGILHCNLSTLDSPSNQFNLHAFLYAARYYDALSRQHDIRWQRSGMLQVAVIPRLQKRFRQLAESGAYAPALFHYLDSGAAGELAGMPLDAPALHFPASGWLSPPTLCKAWVSHPGITVQSGTRVTALAEIADGWRLELQSGAATSTLDVARVVLCNGADLHLFPQTRHYPVIGNRGQVDVYAALEAPRVRTILCGQGYVLPAMDGRQSIGGSYYVGDSSEQAIGARTREHLDFAAQLNPALAMAFAENTPQLQRQGIRCVTPDRMPLAGPARRSPEDGGGKYAGLYLNVGHGSHGLTRTPFCAAWLASLFNLTPPPFADELAQLVLPKRYVRTE
ncbi:MAG TPA: bifunctional tRNA (5-methylaminomethyl-2-thiouridine)(34)-methyltransferase MnmD/FAD-dependent 5-carboxymethylaminomethyl-2-thiouridine(34) oxidoreductase MnmC [Pseudomonadales bacterium]